MGVLFGLYDWRFEVLALVSHAQYLDKTYGVGPHTISVPRWKRAEGVSFQPSFPVSDQDFLKIIAILRMAVPYTGMIISTREPPWLRKIAFKIGISQTSAASQTSPGGYGEGKAGSQFEISDERSLAEVVEGILKQDLLPSFCTACYRSGRTGEDFMSLAKSGKIHTLCRPNAILTFAEYLEDYATEDVKKLGWKVIEKYLREIPKKEIQRTTKERLLKIRKGQRDLYF
jgi:2-iminoacetate synthase